MFKVEIRTENAAFGGEGAVCEREEEVARILEEIASKLRNGRTSGRCTDINGNSVGGFGYDDE